MAKGIKSDEAPKVKVLGVDFETQLVHSGTFGEDTDGRLSFYRIESFFDESGVINLSFHIIYNQEVNKFIVGFRKAFITDCAKPSSGLAELMDREIFQNYSDDKWEPSLNGFVEGSRNAPAVEINDLLDMQCPPTSGDDIKSFKEIGFQSTTPEEIRSKVQQAVRIGVEKLWKKIEKLNPDLAGVL